MYDALTTILLEYLNTRKEQHKLYRYMLESENLSSTRNHSIILQYLSMQRNLTTRENRNNRLNSHLDEMTGILGALNAVSSYSSPASPPIPPRRRPYLARHRGTSTLFPFSNNTVPARPPPTPPTPPTPPPPTSMQIINATVESNYSDISTNQIMCSISRTNFEPDDDILKIIHCGHIFKKQSLNTWFRTHSTCPLCRYNIINGRNYLLPPV
jgi:hypothetical protein